MKIAKRILTVAVCAAMTASVMSFGVFAEELPEKYDLRTEEVLGDVKDQGFVGSCWAFASTGILESWLRLNDMGDFILSPRHVENTTTMAYADCYNYETGDASKVFCSGGFSHTALSYYYGGRGPVLESDYPYIPTYEGKYPMAQRSTEIKTAGISVKDVGIGNCYGDFSFDAVSKTNDIITEMKTAIKNYGGISVSYYATSQLDPNIFTSSYTDTSNHQVMLVGWDDNYPKEKFTDENGLTPQNDGAWIMRNSWGTGDNGETAGDDGYYYMSYETASLYRSPFIYIERAAKTDYDQIYLSSPLAAHKYISSSTDTENNTDYSLNLFEKTAGSQSVTEVTAALRENSYYDIYVIANYEPGGENYGKKVAAGHVDHECYKTFEFDPIEITGDTFGICIKYSSNDKSTSLVPVQDNQYATGYYTGEDFTGKSFISHDGITWLDTAKHYDSTVFVRAYTVNNNETHNVSLPSSYGYATAKLYQNGKEVYKNPDGSFDVENGTYQYEISCMGFETLTGSITVKDKDIKLPYKKMKYAPTITDINSELALKDRGDYEIYYLYGVDGEAPKKVMSVEIGGKKMNFTQTSDSINVDRSQLSFLKEGDTAEIKVTYSNGASSSASVKVVDYSVQAKADILAKRASEELKKLDVKTEKDIIDFADSISQTLKKYSIHAVTRVTDDPDSDSDKTSYRFTAPTAASEGSYGFTLEIRYMGVVKTLNVSGTIDALSEDSLSPKMDGLTGWEDIASSDAFNDAVENGGNLSITLGSSGIIPESFVKKIAGTKAVITFDAFDGRYSWKIDCSDIKNIHDIDTNIYDGTNLSLTDDSILSTSVNIYFMTYKNIPFYVDPSFDITADLTLNARSLCPQLSSKLMFKDNFYSYDDNGILQADESNVSVMTYHSGKTELKDISAGSYVLELTTDYYLFGDVSMDAKGPNKSDVQTLKLYIATSTAEQIREYNPFAYALMDINEDGKVNSDDTKALEEYIESLEKAEK